MENSLEKKGLGKRGIILILIGIVVIFLLVDWILMRAVSLRQVDDFSPEIPCNYELVNKSETLLIIPLFNNISVASNKTWCEQTLALNKTLGMHGVYHSYREFLEPRSEDYIRAGMEEFKKCFGYYPSLFEAPQLALSTLNKKTLLDMGFQIRGTSYTLTHKVYHCQDKGIFATRITSNFNLTNKFIDII
jgi:predicted deacetylase